MRDGFSEFHFRRAMKTDLQNCFCSSHGKVYFYDLILIFKLYAAL